MYSPENEQTMRTFLRCCRNVTAASTPPSKPLNWATAAKSYIASVLALLHRFSLGLAGERTIHRGLDELRQPSSVSLDRIRRKGGAASVVFNP